MKESLDYNVHNIIKFRIVREKKKDFLWDLNLPFSYFETEHVEKPDIILNVGDFKPDNESCCRLDHNNFVKENYFYCRDSGGTASWEVEIQGFEEGVTIINYNGKISGPESLFYPELLPQDIFLRSMIEYKLYKKGFYLLHGAGVSKNNKGYIISGRGSSFKTSISMDLVRKSKFDFMADDKIIMSNDRKLYSFPVHFKSFEFKLRNIQEENFRNASGGIGFNSLINFFKFIRYLRNNDFDYKKIDLPIVDNSDLNELLFVSRTNCNNFKIGRIDQETAANRLYYNNVSDIVKGHTFMLLDYGQYFYKYILLYSFIYPENSLINYWLSFTHNIKNIIQDIPLYEVKIGKNYGKSTFEEISKIIN